MTDRLRRLMDRLDRWSERRRTTRVVRGTIIGFFAHEALQYAGAMAYFAILSIANLLVLAVVAASFVVGEGTARDLVVQRVSHALPLDTDQVRGLIDRAIEARGSVSVVGLVLLLWSALGVFAAMSGGISRVFIGSPRRAFWRERLIGLALLVSIGILGAASVVLGLVTELLQEAVTARITLPGTGLAFAILAFLVPLGLVFFAFLIVYRIVPNRPIDFAEVWPGALVAAILWTALRIGFTFYATRVAKYDTIFGPIGTGITLLVFLYFSSVVLLLGAEVARANTQEVDEERRPPPDAPVEPAEAPAETPG